MDGFLNREPMPSTLHSITSPADLDHVLAESTTVPVLLFKHSPTCGISRDAYDELRAYLGTADAAPVSHYLIVVQEARPLSNAIAARFRIRHESPQALFLRDSRVVWHASHWRITADSLAAATHITA